MPNQTPGYSLFRDSSGWDTSRLPEPYRSWTRESTEQNTMSPLNTGKRLSRLHRYAVEALMAIASESASDIALVKIADGAYASEWHQQDGSYILAYATGAGILSACRYDPLTQKATPLPAIGTPSVEFNVASILALYVFIIADAANAQPGNFATTYDMIAHLRQEWAANATLPETETRLLCDDLYYALSYGGIPVDIRNGNIQLLTARRIENCEFASGAILCGESRILIPPSGVAGSSCAGVSVKAAKAIAESYTSTLSWTKDEELLIPEFPDDTEVPAEVMTMLNRFLASRNWKNPLNNPCWRGITSYGKSTGVKILACILHTPLVWMTCSTTTEVEDFLSKHVPNTDAAVKGVCEELPCFDDILNDPVYAYKMLTGEDKEDVSGDEVLTAYAAAVAEKSAEPGTRPQNPFKVIESDFVQALVKGYIVEVQEFSRIRDSGTLVGLNGFNEPGSVIPMVDGRHVKRHPNAMVVWTDNVGYASCRKVDGSVLRRMSYIIDSFDMPKEKALRRIEKNTGCSDDVFLDAAYDVWSSISQYCKDQDITDEGTCSLTELENWVALSMLEGKENVERLCKEAVVSKLTSDPDSQNEIMDSCVKLALAKAGLTN